MRRTWTLRPPTSCTNLSLRADPHKLQHYLASMRRAAMLSHIDALPGSERHPALGNRNLQRYAVEHGFDMSRHIVRPFHFVHPAGMRRCEPPERGDKVGAHASVGILLNHERCRSVPQIDEDGAVPRLDGVEEMRDVARDFEKAF